FLKANLDDPSNLSSMKDYLDDPRNIEFQQAVATQFKDLSGLEKELTDAFRHVKYYFPKIRIPRVYTYISGGDYDYPIRLADSVLLIAIDCYLGKDYKPYATDGIPLYKAERMIPGQIVPDCMRVMVQTVCQQDPANLTVLEVMTEAGKRIYLLEAFMPGLSGDLLMKYSKPQYEWAMKNESHIWAAIIDNRMLYSTEGRNLRMFMADGPFSSEFSKESAPRLGEWIGLQIIRSYMQENQDITMQQMIGEKDAQRILKMSAYKPGKE
ncbi:MAG TPA: hypothetical protein VLR52_00790, partial [Bacteroidales bacterium]|nr:hypothetical protein [Bacteroidales bacterium]